MKLDVKRRDNGMVELHLTAEDGKITVYLCQDSQAALFKLAQLLFAMGDDPKENRRSILVGTFEKERPKPELTEEQNKLLEEFKKLGFIKVDPNAPPVINPVPYQPSPWVAPTIIPGTAPGSGTITFPGTGGPPYTITYGSTGTSTGYTTYNNSGDVWFTNSGGTLKLTETPIEGSVDLTANSSGATNTFYVSTTTVSPSGGK